MELRVNFVINVKPNTTLLIGAQYFDLDLK